MAMKVRYLVRYGFAVAAACLVFLCGRADATSCGGDNCLGLTTCDKGGCDMLCRDGDECTCNGGGCVMHCTHGSTCVCKKESCIMDCASKATCRDESKASDMRCVGRGTTCCGSPSIRCGSDAKCDGECTLSKDKKCDGECTLSKDNPQTTEESSIEDAPTLQVSRAIPLDAPLLVPVGPHHSNFETNGISYDALANGRDFVVSWKVHGRDRRITTLPDGERRARFVDDLSGTRQFDNLFHTKDGCAYTFKSDFAGADERENTLYGKRSCSKDVQESEPFLIASVEGNGTISNSYFIAGDDFHLIIWTHESNQGIATHYMSRIRAKDGALLDPGGTALPFRSDNWAAATLGDKIVLAWTDVEKGVGPKENTSTEIVRVAFPSIEKGALAVGTPMELSRETYDIPLNTFYQEDQSPRSTGRIAVSGDGRSFVTVWESKGRLMSMRVSTDRKSRQSSKPLELYKSKSLVPQNLVFTYQHKKKTHFLWWTEFDISRRYEDMESERPTPVSGLWINADGGAAGPVLSLGKCAFPTVVASDSSILVLHSDRPTGSRSFDLTGARFDHKGRLLDNAPIPLALMNNAKRDMAAFYGEGMFLVVWRDDRNALLSGEDIFGMRIRAKDGALLDKKAFPISTAPKNQSRPKVSYSNGTFLVVWQDERNANSGMDIYGARVRAKDGALLDPDGMPIAKEVGREQEPEAQCDGGRCMICWRRDLKSDNRFSIFTSEISLTDGSLLPAKGFMIPTQFTRVFDFRYRKDDGRVFFQRNEGMTEWSEASIDFKKAALKNERKKNLRFFLDDEWSEAEGLLMPKGSLFNAALFRPMDRGASFMSYDKTPTRLKTYTALPREPAPPDAPYAEAFFDVALDGGAILLSTVMGVHLRLYVLDAKTANRIGKATLSTGRPMLDSSVKPAFASDGAGHILAVFPEMLEKEGPLIESAEALLLSSSSK